MGPPVLAKAPPSKRMTINGDRRGFTFGEVRLDLTPVECELLRVLLREQNRVVSRSELRLQLWRRSSSGPRVVDTCVSRLRTKLRQAGHPGITVIRNRGYCLMRDV